MNLPPDHSIYRRASNALAQPGVEPAWLAAVRAEALERFLAAGFPGTDDEDWRYTDLRDTAAFTSELLAATPETVAGWPPNELPPRGGADGEVHLVIADGVLHADLSVTPPVSGLAVTRLRDRQEATQQELRERIVCAHGGTSGALFDLNTALLRDAIFVEIAPGARLVQPLHITCAASQHSCAPARIVVTLGAGSHATIVEQHVSDGAAVANTITDVRCGADALLDYARIQLGHDKATHLGLQSMTLGRGASAHLTHLDLGSRLARNDLRVRLVEPGASVSAHGLFIADGSRHLDNHTRIDHLAPRTTSRELYRGIMDGNGHGVFNGKIIVHPGAAGTDARLVNQNLLLARTAEIDTKPELEIYADDVKCSHGATTGQLDPLALFYLKSRGLGADQARRLLIAAFAREIIARAPAGGITDRLSGSLRERLPELTDVGGLS